MNAMKKLFKFICSMRFALILLGILALVCVAGSVITQNGTQNYYLNTYPGMLGMMIVVLGLDDVFHCWWFVLLTVILCLNLLGCNLLRFPQVIRQMKQFNPAAFQQSWDGTYDQSGLKDPEAVMKEMGFHNSSAGTNADGKKYYYCSRNHLGVWGAWLTHLGMLIIIVGFSLGQMYTVKYTVYGVTGQTKAIGDTGYELTIDDFEVDLREDETVEQYTSQLTITDTNSGESHSGQTSVNYPLSLFGMKFYQNSTGWAAKVTIVRDEEEIIQEGILCAGEYTQVGDVDGLYVMFNAFYPDYALDADGNPQTVSSELNNPGYLYSVYYNDEVIGMNVLTGTEMITIENYAIIFSEPQQYTLIQAKRDPFTWLALIGGLIIMAALFISFFVRAEELWALEQEDGTWSFTAKSRKGGVLYKEKLQEAAKRVSES